MHDMCVAWLQSILACRMDTLSHTWLCLDCSRWLLYMMQGQTALHRAAAASCSQGPSESQQGLPSIRTGSRGDLMHIFSVSCFAHSTIPSTQLYILLVPLVNQLQLIGVLKSASAAADIFEWYRASVYTAMLCKACMLHVSRTACTRSKHPLFIYLSAQ